MSRLTGINSENTMSFTLIDLKVQSSIATITLNRPDKRNAMSDAMRSEFVQALEMVAADKAIKALVLTGAGKGDQSDFTGALTSVRGNPSASCECERHRQNQPASGKLGGAGLDPARGFVTRAWTLDTFIGEPMWGSAMRCLSSIAVELVDGSAWRRPTSALHLPGHCLCAATLAVPIAPAREGRG